MSDSFGKVRDFVMELGLAITREVPEEEVLIVDDEDRGIQSLVLDCEEDVLVLEQLILELGEASAEEYRRILQLSRELVYGAFVLDESGRRLLYRNTLALEHLDMNELESTINALSLALAENHAELLALAAE